MGNSISSERDLGDRKDSVCNKIIKKLKFIENDSVGMMLPYGLCDKCDKFNIMKFY